jgi:hypothetical protein
MVRRTPDVAGVGVERTTALSKLLLSSCVFVSVFVFTDFAGVTKLKRRLLLPRGDARLSTG